MLTQNELNNFLVVLLNFATTLGLSDRAMAELMGVSNKTMSRWMNAARESDPQHTVYRHKAKEIANKINYLMPRVDPVALGIRTRGERLQVLKDALASRSV
ncbi:hypothetical protein [Pseudomonas mediterranea]|uniref:hypothetical protein n=1 Tax=Pseudomonas mediterranea TaxID=183795 RepID=UPI0006D8A9B5|nr:hypothetical protein [Pseudomonas mediterranea]